MVWLPDTHRLEVARHPPFGGCQTPTVWLGLPDTHRLASGFLIAANRSECGCLEPQIALERERANAARSRIPGFRILLDLFRRDEKSVRYADWIWGEIEKAMPRSLTLANDLEYIWGSTDIGPLTQDEAEALRRKMIAWARENFDGKALSRCLGSSQFYTLHHFVRHQHVQSGPTFGAADRWWLVEPLLLAISLAKDVVAPQACILLSCPLQFISRDENGRTGRVTRDDLDNELLESLVPATDARRHLLELLAETPLPGNTVDSNDETLSPGESRDPSVRNTVEAVRGAVRAKLEEVVRSG
jgi:hypothetical protein